jgi:hypothetical protein
MSKKDLKIELKSIAKEIISNKEELKKFQKENNGYDGGYYFKIFKLKYEFRHKHIAYCQLRGRKYEEIESTTHTDPNFDYIKEIVDANQEIPQDVRACA